MNYKDILLTASSNMLRSKLRTFLTILAVFIGSFTLTLTNGIGSGISDYVNRQVANLGQNNSISISAKSTSSAGFSASDAPQKYEEGKITTASGDGPNASVVLLTDKDLDTLRSNADLADIYPNYSVNPDYIQSENSDRYVLTVAGVESSATLDLAAGNQLNNQQDRAEIILPLSYVETLGYGNSTEAVGKTVTIAATDATSTQHTVTARIAGIVQRGLVGSNGAVMNEPLRKQLYDLQSIGLPTVAKGRYIGATTRITGEVTDERLEKVKDALDAQGYSAQTFEDQIGVFTTVLSAVTYVLNGFAIIALLAASFGIVNTLFMSVQERTKEIGLMKAMGMKNSRIFALFSVEAVLIGFWGSILGIVTAYAAGTGINRIASSSVLEDLPGFNLLVFPLQSIALIVLLISTISFLAGSLPARRASKQNPIDALRYE